MMHRVVNAGPVVTALTGTFNQPSRNMATLKQISMRLKSVKNIQKITQSMKMVSAAKYDPGPIHLTSQSKTMV